MSAFEAYNKIINLFDIFPWQLMIFHYKLLKLYWGHDEML